MQEERFTRLIDDYQPLIYKVCHLYADTPQDVEDLFQEIVLNLWRAFPSFREEAQVSTWMYRVALNTAITRMRKVTRRQALELDEGTAVDLSHIPAPSGEQQADLQQMYAAIKRLDRVERALVMLYLEDRSYREMAAVMGITENNVGVRLNRIKKKLKEWVTADAAPAPTGE